MVKCSYPICRVLVPRFPRVSEVANICCVCTKVPDLFNGDGRIAVLSYTNPETGHITSGMPRISSQQSDSLRLAGVHHLFPIDARLCASVFVRLADEHP
ncbi:hypothetical protein PISMIDRAFT_416016 [Pisolithus microcarpus 441]|uniref:Uncharacterized protein n=1 Tax=Pisolithus microcarpus 441 TaxID=765257 RepID=A0A0C9YH08_9AGAM|nr:hypothetical protein PISMIDRAFT_416016 [Pisolithus microcarpus 441]